MKGFFIANAARYVVPRLPFSKIAETVLGTEYELSVVFVSPTEIKRLNRIYRKKNTSTDILAFPLSKTSGELYISMPDVKRKAPLFGLSARSYLAYLCVHGCLHLKEYDHGTRMDRLEREYCKKLKFSYPNE